MDDKTDIFDGKWVASSMGQFVGMLVDNGDPAVIFRVTGDGEPDADGKFVRSLDVILIPNGHVERVVKAFDCDRVHRVLAGLISRRVVL